MFYVCEKLPNITQYYWIQQNFERKNFEIFKS